MAQLISGEAYSLSEIFCGENDKVIIPDLQRDYCWGILFQIMLRIHLQVPLLIVS